MMPLAGLDADRGMHIFAVGKHARTAVQSNPNDVNALLADERDVEMGPRLETSGQEEISDQQPLLQSSDKHRRT
jgi:hypothetical protein